MHKTDYRFYYKRYSSAPSDAPIDLEVMYECDYMKFSNLVPDGEISNVYEETFAEHSGCNVFIPDKNDLAFKPYECKLKIMFKGEDSLLKAQAFHRGIRGEKIEYHDTFRKVYATLLMTKPMEIDSECLYGNQQFVVAVYTFTNILGYTYNATKL